MKILSIIFILGLSACATDMEYKPLRDPGFYCVIDKETQKEECIEVTDKIPYKWHRVEPWKEIPGDPDQ